MKHLLAVFLLLGVLSSPVMAQYEPDSASIESFSEEARQMVDYMAYIFNTLGRPSTSPREKEIIINESYDKIFVDQEVQIEDDLIPKRSVVTNKDVQAYLKDIDFFFESVQFDYLVDQVSYDIKEDGQWYFLVQAERRINGLTIDGDSIKNSQPRFLEINLYPEERMLKIASIYTSRLSEQADLANWWNALSLPWKRFFNQQFTTSDNGVNFLDLLGPKGQFGKGDTIYIDKGKTIYVGDSSIRSLALSLLSNQPPQQIRVGDSVRIPEFDTLSYDVDPYLDQLRKALAIKKLDLSGHWELSDLSPLSKLRQLRELNLTRTGVSDLTPLRNLAYLRVLNISQTPVFNLSPLKYNDALEILVADASELTRLGDLKDLPQLKVLSIARTLVSDLGPVMALSNLEELHIDSTFVLKLDGIEGLSKLRLLDLSYTNVVGLGPLQGLSQLEVLKLEGTEVSSLDPLQESQSLRVLYADGTQVLSLRPLEGLKKLRRVYSDQTLIQKAEVNRFQAIRSDVTVIYASATLLEWWSNLPEAWKNVFWPDHQGQTPSRDQLQVISELDSLSLDQLGQIQSLDPIKVLDKLRYVSISSTSISDLSVLSEATELRYLDCSNTPIGSLDPLAYLKSLEVLDISHTTVSSLLPLAQTNSLTRLIGDHCPIQSLTPLESLDQLNFVSVDETAVSVDSVRKFIHSGNEALVIFDNQQTREWWETLSEPWQEILRTEVSSAELPSDSDLHQMRYLKSLSINATEIDDLGPLTSFIVLEELELENTKVSDLSPIQGLKTLKKLSFPRHSITSLFPLSGLLDLELLNCQNTPIEDLEPLAGLSKMEDLNCSGTQIRDLSSLGQMLQLRHLDISNTDIKRLNEIEELSRLTLLECYNTRISEKRMQKFKNSRPSLEVVYY